MPVTDPPAATWRGVLFVTRLVSAIFAGQRGGEYHEAARVRRPVRLLADLIDRRVVDTGCRGRIHATP
ncbi:hypothetical protein DRB17_08120 [Ferruginivarius sediminum]|uniref:Uncharacterized protein n=1 Tax=Ferruginivarius sediminum TaxID=2661937 RepID=A0A369TA52_9PROT|nr:hypothetical protein DRB17_08120 [Ferruginivarius sediminum]